jgi:hypothetical protein
LKTLENKTDPRLHVYGERMNSPSLPIIALGLIRAMGNSPNHCHRHQPSPNPCHGRSAQPLPLLSALTQTTLDLEARPSKGRGVPANYQELGERTEEFGKGVGVAAGGTKAAKNRMGGLGFGSSGGYFLYVTWHFVFVDTKMWQCDQHATNQKI